MRWGCFTTTRSCAGRIVDAQFSIRNLVLGFASSPSTSTANSLPSTPKIISKSGNSSTSQLAPSSIVKSTPHHGSSMQDKSSAHSTQTHSSRVVKTNAEPKTKVSQDIIGRQGSAQHESINVSKRKSPSVMEVASPVINIPKNSSYKVQKATLDKAVTESKHEYLRLVGLAVPHPKTPQEKKIAAKIAAHRDLVTARRRIIIAQAREARKRLIAERDRLDAQASPVSKVTKPVLPPGRRRRTSLDFLKEALVVNPSPTGKRTRPSSLSTSVQPQSSSAKTSQTTAKPSSVQSNKAGEVSKSLNVKALSSFSKPTQHSSHAKLNSDALLRKSRQVLSSKAKMISSSKAKPSSTESTKPSKTSSSSSSHAPPNTSVALATPKRLTRDQSVRLTRLFLLPFLVLCLKILCLY